MRRLTLASLAAGLRRLAAAVRSARGEPGLRTWMPHPPPRGCAAPLRWPLASVAALAAGLVVGGCMTMPWVPTEPVYRSAAHHYTVELPQGWVRYTQDRDQDVAVTRDGPLLQLIFIERVPVGRELSNTRKRLVRGMIPQEAAEVILDNLASNEKLTAFEVRENAPSRLSGRPGFKAVVTYKTRDGLRVKSAIYGSLVGDDLYVVRYTAPQRYYFDRDLEAFERVVRTFKLERS